MREESRLERKQKVHKKDFTAGGPPYPYGGPPATQYKCFFFVHRHPPEPTGPHRNPPAPTNSLYAKFSEIANFSEIAIFLQMLAIL